ncbi:MAG: NAD-dependent epimerase/dehydratase family protein [Pseudomonadota bacterium]
MTVLVTGGSGFVGAAVIRRLLARGFDVASIAAPSDDRLFDRAALSPRCRRITADLCDGPLVEALVEEVAPDAILHCAADGPGDHVDAGPAAFLHTNVTGTFQILEAARIWCEGRRRSFRFVHVLAEDTPGGRAWAPALAGVSTVRPARSGAAGQCASSHMVSTWGEAYGLPVVTTACAATYGPRQCPEKLIPLMTINAIERRVLPVFGAGTQMRDWVHVDDHAAAVERALVHGTPGARYTIGGGDRRRTLDVVRAICAEIDRRLPQRVPRDHLIRHVPDRVCPSDRDNPAPVGTADLGWQPSVPFDQGLADTIGWYIRNRPWWEAMREARYGGRRLGVLPGASAPTGRKIPVSEAVS